MSGDPDAKQLPGILMYMPVQWAEGETLISQQLMSVAQAPYNGGNWGAANMSNNPFPYPLDGDLPSGVGLLDQYPFYPVDAETDFSAISPDLITGERSLHQILLLR